MTLATLQLGSIAVLIGLLAIYIGRYRHQDEGVYSPVAAWLRAFIYFSVCWQFAYLTGALTALMASPFIPTNHVTSPLWWALTAALLLFVFFAYWHLWARWTLRFERRLDIFPQGIFGICWGLAYSLCFLGFWHLAGMLLAESAVWGQYLLAYLLISVWQYLWQDFYWDIYIAPEHDTAWTIRRKVPLTHVPNITLCLLYFAVYEAYWLFVATQVLALLGCAFAMRMPAPWSREVTPAAMKYPLAFGVFHGGGYVSDNPENDPYLKSIGAPY